MNKVFRIRQIVWFVIGVVALGTCIYALVGGRKDDALDFAFCSIMAFLMLFLRRGRWKKLSGGSK